VNTNSDLCGVKLTSISLGRAIKTLIKTLALRENKMKTRLTAKKRLTPLLIGLTVSTLMSISPSSLAANPNWASDYVGELTFKLSDDQGLQERKQRLNQIEKRFQKIHTLVEQKSSALNKLQNERKNNKAQISKLSGELTKIINEKEALKKQKKALKAKLPKIQEEIKVAKAAVTGANAVVNQTKTKITNLEKKLEDAQTQCTATPTEKCQKQITKLTQRIEKNKTQLKEQQNTLALTNKNLAAKQKSKKDVQAQIEAKNTKIAALETSSAQKAAKVTQLQAKQKTLKTAIAQGQTELKPLVQRKRQVKVKLNEAEQDKKNYRQNLIARVLDVNKKGAVEGGTDGHTDGADLADDIGNYNGNSDGDFDGDEDGTSAGQDRDYRSGNQSGKVAGANRARSEGEANGTREGSYQGNVDAAKSEGHAAGVQRAVDSDAAVVGTKAGQKDGLARAVRTGKIEGTQTGEQQAIAKNENATLKNVKVDGAFSGAFDRVIPRYPLGRRGDSYNPSQRYRRSVVTQAYRAGYEQRYRRRHRAGFDYYIAQTYTNAYDRSYESAYDDSFSRDYPRSREAGFNAGELSAFNANYSTHYTNFYNQHRSEHAANPVRSSSEYRTTFNSTEALSFAQKYSAIKTANYNQAEGATFNANIAAQTEIYRKKRFSTVQAVYSNNPVLEYVSSDMKDGGINGVAKLDGVFQPNETTLHSVTVMNYGLKAADNAKVVLDNGQSFKLPSIPAQSKVTIVGVAKGNVQGNIGSTNTKGITVYSPLVAEAKIQGRHFANKSNGQLNAMDVKRTPVKYPLVLTSLATKTTPLIGESTPLNISLQNVSSRDYKGELEIIVDVDSSTNILAKPFAKVNHLGRNAVLSDARVLVASEEDVYQPLSFNAKIMKNGVLLGRLTRSFETMAKSPYKEKAGKNVILVNSDQARRDLIQVLDKVGGLKAVSVLDSTLVSQNSKVMAAGLKGKTVLALTTGNKAAVDQVAKRSSNSVLIFLNRRGLEDAKSMRSFKEAQSFEFFLKGTKGGTKFIFSNPLEAKGLKASIVGMQSDLNNYNSLMTMASYLKLNNDQLLNKIKTTFNAKNFFENTVSKRQLLHAGLIRSLDENTRISKHYENSGNWTNRNKDIVDKVYDNKYFHKKLANSVGSNPKDNTVGLYMFAHDFYESLRNGLKYYRPISKNTMSKLRTRLFDGKIFSKSAALKPIRKSKDKLRKKFKSEYKKIKKNRGYIAPFVLAKESDNNGKRR